MEDISNGNDGLRFMSWITRFHQRVLETSSSSEQDPVDLDARLSGLSDVRNGICSLLSIHKCPEYLYPQLITWVFKISGTSTGYSLFRSSASLFLRLAALSPHLWTGDAAISISEALRAQTYDIRKFVLNDTVTALVVGLPPLIHYDATSSWAEEDEFLYTEWVYGFPAGLVILLAKINSWRVSRLMGQVPNCNEWHEIEKRLMGWSPTLNHTEEAREDVARLAIQEAWRQAALVYLYMVRQ